MPRLFVTFVLAAVLAAVFALSGVAGADANAAWSLSVAFAFAAGVVYFVGRARAE